MELATGALFILAGYLMAPGMPLLGGLIFCPYC
jgi:general secretion pathway protein O